jgi:hypothetical protein
MKWHAFLILAFFLLSNPALAHLSAQEKLPPIDKNAIAHITVQKGILDEDVYEYTTRSDRYTLFAFSDSSRFDDAAYTAQDRMKLYADEKLTRELGVIEAKTPYILLQLGEDRRKAFVTISTERDKETDVPMPTHRRTGWIDIQKPAVAMKKTLLLRADDLTVESMNPYLMVTYKNRTYYHKYSLFAIGPRYSNPVIFFKNYLLLVGEGWELFEYIVLNLANGKMEFRFTTLPKYSKNKEMFFALDISNIGLPTEIQIFEVKDSVIVRSFRNEIKANFDCSYDIDEWVTDGEIAIRSTDGTCGLRYIKQGVMWNLAGSPLR